MLVSYDVDAGATYVRLSSDDVARTAHVSDLVMVDLNEHGDPVGVEFVVPPAQVSDKMLWAVADRFESLKPLAADRSWLLTTSEHRF